MNQEVSMDQILRKKYILALSIIACLVILSQLAIQFSINKNEDDSRVINIAGRQRMLSQRISKCAFGILLTDDPIIRYHYVADMMKSIELWETSQKGLQYGNAEIGLPGNNSDKVKMLFAEIEHKKNIIIKAANNVIALTVERPVDYELLKENIQIISYNGDYFLEGMDKIVSQYDREAKGHIELVERIEICLMAITLFILVMEAVFIFKPFEKQVREILFKIRKNEESITNAKEEFQAIFENSQVGMMLLKQYRLIYKTNQRLADILGYDSPDEMTGMSVLDIHLSAERFEAYGKRHYDTLTQGEQIQVEYQLKRKDGSPVWCTLSGKAIDLNKPPNLNKGVIWVIDDISGRKASEEQLRQSLDVIDTLIKSMPFGFIIVGKDRRIIDVNQAALDMMGRATAKELQGAFCHECICPAGKLCPILDLGQSVDRSERILVHRDGRHIPIDKTALQITLNNEDVFLEAFVDISERKRAEEERARLEAENRLLQKAESLGRMAGAIAHLFNNQLSVVMGNLELALMRLSEDAVIRKNLLAAMGSAGRSAEISGLMLTCLGQSTARRRPLDLSDICRQNLPRLWDVMPEGIALKTDLLPSGPVVHAHKKEMQQVLTHLISNGWESIGQSGGTVALTTRIVPAGEISQSHLLPIGWKPSAEVFSCLEVMDTGSGIPEYDLEKIFDPFFTTKFTGRGLGLAVVLGIVKTSGGAIGVESKKDQGSLFRVFLPLVTNELPRPPKRATEINRMEHGSNALLVEDQDLVRNMAKAMLEEMGFEVLAASGGAEAVKLFQANANKVLCVITDLTMPGMNGWETLSALRKIRPHIPAILVSGCDEASAMTENYSEQDHVFLHKPYSMGDLQAALGTVLERPVSTK